jgi:hypothetical protein
MMLEVLLPKVVADPIAVLTKPGASAAMVVPASAVEPKKNVLMEFPVTAPTRTLDEYDVFVPVATLAASSTLPPML